MVLPLPTGHREVKVKAVVDDSASDGGMLIAGPELYAEMTGSTQVYAFFVGVSGSADVAKVRDDLAAVVKDAHPRSRVVSQQTLRDTVANITARLVSAFEVFAWVMFVLAVMIGAGDPGVRSGGTQACQRPDAPERCHVEKRARPVDRGGGADRGRVGRGVAAGGMAVDRGAAGRPSRAERDQAVVGDPGAAERAEPAAGGGVHAAGAADRQPRQGQHPVRGTCSRRTERPPATDLAYPGLSLAALFTSPGCGEPRPRVRQAGRDRHRRSRSAGPGSSRSAAAAPSRRVHPGRRSSR